jgi:hypothetical protein
MKRVDDAVSSLRMLSYSMRIIDLKRIIDVKRIINVKRTSDRRSYAVGRGGSRARGGQVWVIGRRQLGAQPWRTGERSSGGPVRCQRFAKTWGTPERPGAARYTSTLSKRPCEWECGRSVGCGAV